MYERQETSYKYYRSQSRHLFKINSKRSILQTKQFFIRRSREGSAISETAQTLLFDATDTLISAHRRAGSSGISTVKRKISWALKRCWWHPVWRAIRKRARMLIPVSGRKHQETRWIIKERLYLRNSLKICGCELLSDFFSDSHLSDHRFILHLNNLAPYCLFLKVLLVFFFFNLENILNNLGFSSFKQHTKWHNDWMVQEFKRLLLWTTGMRL